RAERTLHRAVRLAKQIRDNVVLADATLTLGVVYLERERFEKAERTLRRGQRMAIETEINYLQIHAQLALAQLRLLDTHEDALRRAEQHAADAIRRGRAAAMIHGIA